MSISVIVLLALAVLASLLMTALAQELWTGDGFGRGMAQGLAIPLAILTWSLLAIAFVLAAIRTGGVPHAWLWGMPPVLVVTFCAAWATIMVGGWSDVPRWLAVVLGVPPLLLAGLVLLAAMPDWREGVPGGVVRAAWVAATGPALLPWPWVIRKTRSSSRTRAKAARR